MARKGEQLTFMTVSPLSHLFAYERGGGGGKLGRPVTRGELSHCQPIPSARAGAGKALAPSCQDTLSLSQNTKRALSWPLQHRFHMLLTAPVLGPWKGGLCPVKRLTCFFFIKMWWLTWLIYLGKNGEWGRGMR